MNISLIGAGCGQNTLTEEAAEAIRESGLVLGPERLIESIPKSLFNEKCRIQATVYPSEHLVAFEEAKAAGIERVAVLFSGDAGFFSGTGKLLTAACAEKNKLGGGCDDNECECDYEFSVMPGISSLQYFSAKLGRPWQDWQLLSAHGVECDVVYAVCQGNPSFILTGGKNDPSSLCRVLTDAGLGFLKVTTGEDLGSEREKIRMGTAELFSRQSFSSLSVILIEPAPRFPYRVPGIADSYFLREKGIPMTSRMVRLAAVSSLAITPSDTCWDIGTGSGSVSIELAMHSRRVYGIERNPAALKLSHENRIKFGAWNLTLIAGNAPEVLELNPDILPRPNAVFVGGSGGLFKEILQRVHSIASDARICVTAITLETLNTAYTVLEGLGYKTSVDEISVSHSHITGSAGLHLMISQNPVYLITALNQI